MKSFDMSAEMQKVNWRKSVVNKTKPSHRIDEMYKRTFDGHQICLEVYEFGLDKWFVILTPAFCGWTRDVNAAFDVFNNAEWFKMQEMLNWTTDPTADLVD